jgi:5-methylcytosine-specific restriction endonuclease McrA
MAKFNRKKKLTDLFNAQSGECVYCDIKMTLDLGHSHTATIDHIVPLSKGGLRDTFNEVASCHECNTKKGDRPFRDFVMDIKHSKGLDFG